MMDLYDRNGHRKYVTPAEGHEFLKAAEAAQRQVRTFCGTLAYTGCRISEALALTGDRVDLIDGVVVIESLKKRRKGIYRAAPVPLEFLDTLNLFHDLRSFERWIGPLINLLLYCQLLDSCRAAQVAPTWPQACRTIRQNPLLSGAVTNSTTRQRFQIRRHLAVAVTLGRQLTSWCGSLEHLF
jgi:integrase